MNQKELSPEVRELSARIFASRMSDTQRYHGGDLRNRLAEITEQAETSIRMAGVFVDYVNNTNPFRTLNERAEEGALTPIAPESSELLIKMHPDE